MDFALCAQRPHRRRTVLYVEDGGPSTRRERRERIPAAPFGSNKEKGPRLIFASGLSLYLLPATTYSPTELPLQYHRRKRA